MGQMHYFCLLDEMLVPRAREQPASICLYLPNRREGLFPETGLPASPILGNSGLKGKASSLTRLYEERAQLGLRIVVFNGETTRYRCLKRKLPWLPWLDFFV